MRTKLNKLKGPIGLLLCFICTIAGLAALVRMVYQLFTCPPLEALYAQRVFEITAMPVVALFLIGVYLVITHE